MTPQAVSAILREPPPPHLLHLVIDMQRLFAEDTAWHAPAFTAILPAVARLSRALPAHTVFARFMPPATPDDTHGRWRHYYRRWRSVTGAHLDPALLDLVPPLAALARPETVVDKATYSAFCSPSFLRLIETRRIDTLVLTGVETDVCVLATLFDAVDRGLRVIVPADAVASGSQAAHDAVLTHVLPRLAEQIDITTVDAVLRSWAVAAD